MLPFYVFLTGIHFQLLQVWEHAQWRNLKDSCTSFLVAECLTCHTTNSVKPPCLMNVWYKCQHILFLHCHISEIISAELLHFE